MAILLYLVNPMFCFLANVLTFAAAKNIGADSVPEIANHPNARKSFIHKDLRKVRKSARVKSVILAGSKMAVADVR